MVIDDLISLEVDQLTGAIKVDPVTGGLVTLAGLACLEQAMLFAVREHPNTIKLVNARPERRYSLLSALEDDIEASFDALRVGGISIKYEAATLELTAELVGNDNRSISIILNLLES